MMVFENVSSRLMFEIRCLNKLDLSVMVFVCHLVSMSYVDVSIQKNLYFNMSNS